MAWDVRHGRDRRASDNGNFVTGVDWNARILPVRVLGKCYGDDTDVADGIVWAAGGVVPAAPANPTLRRT